jgi:uncharacterized protein (DUF2141 family)
MLMHAIRLSALMLLAVYGSSAPAQAAKGDIVVTVQGLRSQKGVVRWALYRSEESFREAVHEDGNSAVRRGTCRPAVSGCRFRISGLPHGEYALLLFHDENNNDEVDKRILGLPKERVGISNYSSLPTRKPFWKRARFDHTSARTPLTVRTFR